MNDIEFRSLINRLNSFCMILIVMMHCVITVNIAGNTYLNDFVFSTFTRIAVPVFFIISGYLLFQHYNINKIVRRTRTVFVPFLLWSIITIAVFAFLQHVPLFSSYFNHQFQLTFESVFTRTFIKPLNGALWFLRDLYILVLISPIILFVNKSRLCSNIVLLCLFIIWIIQPVRFLTESGLFFYLGTYFASRKDLKFSLKLNGNVLFYIFIFLCLIFPTIYNESNKTALIKGLVVLGCITIYFNWRFFLKDNHINRCLDSFKKYSFFVYASHQIVCQFLKKLLLQILPVYNIVSVIVIYILTVCCTIVICIYMQKVLMVVMPKGVILLTGNRC